MDKTYDTTKIMNVRMGFIKEYYDEGSYIYAIDLKDGREMNVSIKPIGEHSEITKEECFRALFKKLLEEYAVPYRHQ